MIEMALAKSILGEGMGWDNFQIIKKVEYFPFSGISNPAALPSEGFLTFYSGIETRVDSRVISTRNRWPGNENDRSWSKVTVVAAHSVNFLPII